MRFVLAATAAALCAALSPAVAQAATSTPSVATVTVADPTGDVQGNGDGVVNGDVTSVTYTVRKTPYARQFDVAVTFVGPGPTVPDADDDRTWGVRSVTTFAAGQRKFVFVGGANTALYEIKAGRRVRVKAAIGVTGGYMGYCADAPDPVTAEGPFCSLNVTVPVDALTGSGIGRITGVTTALIWQNNEAVDTTSKVAAIKLR